MHGLCSPASGAGPGTVPRFSAPDPLSTVGRGRPAAGGALRGPRAGVAQGPLRDGRARAPATSAPASGDARRRAPGAALAWTGEVVPGPAERTLPTRAASPAGSPTPLLRPARAPRAPLLSSALHDGRVPRSGKRSRALLWLPLRSGARAPSPRRRPSRAQSREGQCLPGAPSLPSFPAAAPAPERSGASSSVRSAPGKGLGRPPPDAARDPRDAAPRVTHVPRGRRPAPADLEGGPPRRGRPHTARTPHGQDGRARRPGRPGQRPRPGAPAGPGP